MNFLNLHRLLKITYLALLLSFGVQVLAHAGHNKISGYQATQVAAKLTQKMTFKDMGYQAGKLDKSWKEVNKDVFKLEDVQPEFYLVRAYNTLNKETLEYKISKDGQVLHVISQP